MKKYFLFSTLLCYLFIAGNARSQTWEWVKGSYSFYSGAFVDGGSISTDAHGNVYTLGEVGLIGAAAGEITEFGTCDITDSSTFSQIYITKSSPSGTFLWAIGSQITGAYPINIANDPQGHLYVYGSYSGNCHFTTTTISSTSNTSYFLAKFDTSGNVLWMKNVTGVDSIPLGLSTCGMGVDKNGSVYVTGSFPGASITIGATTLLNADVTGNTFDVFAAKYDSAGNNVWAKKYGGTSNDLSYGIAVANDGEVYLSGFYLSPTVAFGTSTLTNTLGTLDTPYIYIAKLDTAGNAEWANSAKACKWDNMGGMACDKDNNAYLTGGYNNPQITFDTHTLTSAGGGDAYIVKYNLSGSVVFANNIGGNNVDDGFSVAVDSCQNVWVCGMMGGAGLGAGYTINIGSHTLTTPTGGTDPFFLAEYDSTGAYLNSLATQSGAEDKANAITVDNQGNLLLGADFNLPTFTLGSTSLTLGTTLEDMYVAKYNYMIGTCRAASLDVPEENATSIALFPNPAFNELTITSPTTISSIEITNYVGQAMYTHICNTNETTINIANLKAGIYFVKINGLDVRKFVKE